MSLAMLIVLGIDVVLILATVYLVLSILSVWRVPPFISTRPQVVEEVVKVFGMLPRGSTFYDLGSGDGGVVLAMAERNPDSRCIGIEKYFFPYVVSRSAMMFRRLPNASIHWGDIYSMDYTKATHVYTYLYNATMDALLPKLQKELPKGAVLVSLDFPFSRIEPTDRKMLRASRGALGRTIYTYSF